MPIIDKSSAPVRTGSGYPAPFNIPCIARSAVKLGDAGGLTQFGAHMVTMAPGAWSSQRHHHSHEDEFVYVVSGTPSFIDDDGETLLSPGDCTAHPAGDGNAHHMINRTEADAVLLVIGSRKPEIDSCAYPDIDLAAPADCPPNCDFTHKDGTPYA